MAVFTVALLVLGLVLLVAEAHLPTFGVLGFAVMGVRSHGARARYRGPSASLCGGRPA